MNDYITLTQVEPRSMTDEERARVEAFDAEQRALSAAMTREAVELVRCPTCKVEPGSECIWRIRHLERVHAPRLYRTPTWKAGR
jgi:hypothetical protein